MQQACGSMTLASPLILFHQGSYNNNSPGTFRYSSYLAVAEDRQFFTIMINEMLDKRGIDFYTICPSNLVLRKSINDNYLIALFMGKTEVALRKYKQEILKDFESIWIRSPDSRYWVYSLK
jgi:hypothetical protein